MNPEPTTSIPPTINKDQPTTAASAAPDSNISFWKAWPWWAIPAAIALALVLWFVDPFIGDWDGLDYTMLSIAGYPSSMALGRNLFIFENYFLYKVAQSLFQVRPENAYLIFKYTVVVQAPLAIVASWILARDISTSVRTATLSTLFIVFSPVFVLYGGQVMTDVPAVLLLSVALVIHYRGLKQQKVWMVLFGAALLGLGLNLRETIGLYAPWLFLAPVVSGWKFRRRELLIVLASLLIFAVMAFGWFGYWFITDHFYRGIWYGWRESMRQETARHPVSVRNLWPYFAYFFVSAPVVFLSLPFALRSEWRRNRLSPMLLLAAIGLVADLMLFLNYSTAVNWRYFLTGLPALGPVCATFLLRKLSPRFGVGVAFACWVTLVFGLAVVFALLVRPASKQFVERRAMSKMYRESLAKLPQDGILIAGAQTIAVTYWKAIGLGKWQTIGTGGGWPGDENFVPLVEAYLNQNRRVFIDTDPRWWLPCGWQRDEIPVIVSLEKHFRFRRVTDTIYEIRPRSDASANDVPRLETLLPENRPEDTQKCTRLQG